ncbi:phenylalanine--tRNA ligase subunit alpha, partial [Amycolatopsis mediterranei]
MSGATEKEVQGAVLAPETLQEAVKAAEAAFAAATGLERLAEVKPAHLGDHAPLMLARREIGAL